MSVKEERGEGSWFKSFRIQKSIQHPFSATFQLLCFGALSSLIFLQQPPVSSLTFQEVCELCDAASIQWAVSISWPLLPGRKPRTSQVKSILGSQPLNKGWEVAIAACTQRWRWWLNLQWGGKNCLPLRTCCVFSIQVPNLDPSAEVNQADVHCQHTHTVN